MYNWSTCQQKQEKAHVRTWLLFINIAAVKPMRARTIIYANASEFGMAELVRMRGKITLLRIYSLVIFTISGIRMFYINSDLWRFMKYLKNLTFGCSRKPKLWESVSGKRGWEVEKLRSLKQCENNEHSITCSCASGLVRKTKISYYGMQKNKYNV